MQCCEEREDSSRRHRAVSAKRLLSQCTCAAAATAMGSVGRSPESVLVGKRTRILCTSGLRVGCMPCYDAELRMLVSYRPLANSRETFDDVEQEYPRQHGRGLYSARLGKVKRLLPAAARATPPCNHSYGRLCQCSRWGRRVDAGKRTSEGQAQLRRIKPR